ncbi:hypothetical protein E4T39_05690 [Aureobasidium subglaciale]|nr:hypothetical protein E4T39_05690 [Aureobasidium subglaciale]
MTDASSQVNSHLLSQEQEGAGKDDDARPPKRARRESQDRQRREIGLMRQSDGANAPSFVGSSSGIHFVRSVYQALTKSRVQVSPQTPDQNMVPGEEDQLDEATPYSSKRLWSSTEVNESMDENASFDFEDLQMWSESYFEHWHTAYPFIHAPTILECLERDISSNTLTDLGKQHSPRFTIVRSVMSISLADRKQSGHPSERAIPADLVFTSFKEATESVQDMLFIPSSIEALQAVLSVQLFLVSMLRLNGASKLGGMIVRMAFQLGLHRCPSRYGGFDAEQAEIRRRLFWTIYCIDRHLCQSLGLPLTIRDDDVDVCYFDEEKHAPHHQRRIVMDDRLRVLNLLTKHASIKGQIMELRNKSIHQRSASQDLATSIAAHIEKWANDLQFTIEAAKYDEADEFNKLHEIVLSVLQDESIISLNRPLLALEKHAPEYMAALQICIRASRSIISRLKNYLASIDNPDSTMLQPPLLWPSLTWCVWMSAFIVLHAAIEGEMPKPIARRLADQSVVILRHLALRGSVWPNSDLFSHAANVPGPSPSNSELHLSIPWLNGSDAAAATSNNIFEQFDIPFWMGDDQYTSLMNFDL